MTTIVYNECITSISLLLKNVNDLYTRETEAVLKLSKLEKENESLRRLLASKETGLHKEAICQQVGYVEMTFGEVWGDCVEKIVFHSLCFVVSKHFCLDLKEEGLQCILVNDHVNAYFAGSISSGFPISGGIHSR